MEKNTVLLDVEKYNELRDFKQKIEEGKTLSIYSGFDYCKKSFITTDKAILAISDANSLLQKANEDLIQKNRKATEENKLLQKANEDLQKENNQKTNTDKLRKMSYWEFRLWKRWSMYT